MRKVDTSRFHRSHFSNPKGRGGWLFENEDGEVVFSHSGTYTEAKQAALKFAAKKDLLLYVCP